MRRGVVPTLALTVAVLLAGCSDDGGDDDAGSTSTTAADAAATSDAPTTAATDPTTTSDPAATTTTSPNLAPSDSPLGDLLVPPATFGTGFAPDDTYGDGTFDSDLCEDVTLDPTWDDQAGQALSAGEATVSQAVLRFADAEAATGFVADLVDGWTTCDPNLVPDTGDLAGDETAVATTSDEEGHQERGVVRVGPLVTIALAFSPDGAPIFDDGTYTAMADLLTAG